MLPPTGFWEIFPWFSNLIILDDVLSTSHTQSSLTGSLKELQLQTTTWIHCVFKCLWSIKLISLKMLSGAIVNTVISDSCRNSCINLQFYLLPNIFFVTLVMPQGPLCRILGSLKTVVEVSSKSKSNIRLLRET